MVDGRFAFQLNKTSPRAHSPSLRYEIFIKMYKVCYESQTSLMKNFCSLPAASKEQAAGMHGEEIPPFFCTGHPVKIMLDHGNVFFP